jgi:hypothetical protein
MMNTGYVVQLLVIILLCRMTAEALDSRRDSSSKTASKMFDAPGRNSVPSAEIN